MATRRAATTQPAAAADPAGFEDAFLSFLRALRLARGRAARDPSFAGLSLAQYQLLEAVDAIGRDGNARVAEVAGTAEPTATRALAGLERRGLITRERGEDRRLVRIALTGSLTVTDKGDGLLRGKSCRGDICLNSNLSAHRVATHPRA